jgi:hypothetical protein
MKALLIVAATICVAGCQTNPPDPRVVAFEAGQKSVNLDPRVLAECPDLPRLKGPTDKDAIEATKAWIDAYAECRRQKAALNGIVRDAFNIKGK